MIPFHESEIENEMEYLGVCVWGGSFIALHPRPASGIMFYGAVSALSCQGQTRQSEKQSSTVNAIVLEFSKVLPPNESMPLFLFLEEGENKLLFPHPSCSF